MSAIIEGDVTCNSIEYAHNLIVRNCIFKGHFDISEAHFAKSLDLSYCTFEKNVNLFGLHTNGSLSMAATKIQDGRQQQGPANFRQIKVARQVDLSGAQVVGDLNLQGATVEGNLYCRVQEGQRTEISGAARLFGLKVAGVVDVSGARIGGVLDLEKAEIIGHLYCGIRQGQRTEISGIVRLLGANVGGMVNLRGAWIGKELNLQSARIEGGIFCQAEKDYHTEIGGRAWLGGAKVAVIADLSGAQITGDLGLDNLTLEGHLHCKTSQGQRTIIGGGVQLAGAHVAGEADFGGIQIDKALNLRGATIEGGIRCLPEGTFRPEIGGQVRLDGAKVAVIADFSGAQIAGDLSLQGTEIQGDLLCVPRGDHSTAIGGGINLQTCRVRRINLDGQSCNKHALNLSLAQITEFSIQSCLPTKIDLEGTQFQRLTLPPGNDYLKLLKTTEPFKKSTYISMEQWLRNQGDEENANQVYLAMRRQTRKEGMHILSRLGSWLLDFTIRYGLNSHRLFFYYFLPVLFLSWLLFLQPQAVERRITVTTNALKNPQVDQDYGVTPQNWTMIDAFWLSLQTNLPMVSILAVDKWTPSSNPIMLLGWRVCPLSFDESISLFGGKPCLHSNSCCLRYDIYASIVSLVNWIVVPLFLAGISGIIKKQE